MTKANIIKILCLDDLLCKNQAVISVDGKIVGIHSYKPTEMIVSNELKAFLELHSIDYSNAKFMLV